MKKPKKAKESPCDKANFISKLLCWWVTHFLRVNYGKAFGVEDLDECSKHDHSSLLGEKLNR